MTTAAAIFAYLSAQPVALNDEGRAPRRIHLLPKGPAIQGRDGRAWRLTRPQAVADAFARNGAPIPVDYEHGSMLAQNGEARPAAGWIESVEIDDDGIWGVVTWTPRGEELVANREYRFISPAFTFDPVTREIEALRAAGLVHHPNLHLAALNSRGAGHEESVMLTDILRALGLPEAATAADAVVAINTLKSEKQVALNAAQHPPVDRFIPIEQHTQTVTALNSANTELDRIRAEQSTARATALVDDAVKAGKVTPASREAYLALALNNYDGAAAAVATLPVIVAPGADPGLKTDPAQGGAAALTAAQVALCRQLGISEKDYLATSI